MTVSNLIRRAKIAVAVLALLVAGCAGNDSSIDPDQLNQAELIYEATVGNPGSNSEDLVAFLIDQSESRQDKLSACMREQGHQFFPAVESTGSEQGAADALEKLPGTIEYAEEYGFGITTGPDSNLSSPDDPNLTYFNSLDANEQEGYNLALYGSGGCMEQADATQIRVDEVLREYESIILESIEETFEDPQYHNAVDGWSTCMAEKGYESRSVDEFRNDILTRFNALGADPELGSPEMESLRVEELAAATAVADCDAKLDDELDSIFSSSTDKFDSLYRNEIVQKIYEVLDQS